MASTIRGDDNFDSAGPFGHWTPLSEVTLGGSAVSAIDITLPSGYDKHRLDFVLPTQPSGASGTALLLNMLSSGGSAQSSTYTVMWAGYPANRNQNDGVTDMYFAPDVGDAINANQDTYIHGVMEILDANSSSLYTRFLCHMGAALEYDGSANVLLGQGTQTTGTASTTSKFRFKWQNGSNFATGSEFYYRLYGHSYS
jgi:hypothetical protein